VGPESVAELSKNIDLQHEEFLRCDDNDKSRGHTLHEGILDAVIETENQEGMKEAPE